MDKSLDRWLSVLYPPKKGTLQSEAPGAGPAEADSGTFLGGDRQSNAAAIPTRHGFKVTPGFPPVDPPDASGYGGGGDTAYFVAPPTSTSMDPNAVLAARQSEFGAIRYMPPPPAIPRFNAEYSTKFTSDDLGDNCDIFASGTITPVATAVTVNVTIAQTIVNGMLAPVMRYPGGIQAFLILNRFSASPSVSTETGCLSWTFTDSFGSQPIALCTSLGNVTATGVNLPANCTNSFTDPGINGGVIGTLTATQTGALGTAGAWAWSMNFAIGLLLPVPAFKAYVPDQNTLREAARRSA